MEEFYYYKRPTFDDEKSCVSDFVADPVVDNALENACVGFRSLSDGQVQGVSVQFRLDPALNDMDWIS